MGYHTYMVMTSCMLDATCFLQYRILNKLTPEKFDLLKGQLIDSGITTADILKVSLFLDMQLVLFFPEILLR